MNLWHSETNTPPKVIAKRVDMGLMQYENFGLPGGEDVLVLNKLCSGCQEFWPADTEFFARCTKKSPDGLTSLCKACATEARRKSRNRSVK